jgi:hypothetical protein
MCPVCVSTAALITAGITSTGGIATLVVSAFRKDKKTNNGNGLDRNGEAENG